MKIFKFKTEKKSYFHDFDPKNKNKIHYIYELHIIVKPKDRPSEYKTEEFYDKDEAKYRVKQLKKWAKDTETKLLIMSGVQRCFILAYEE